MINKERINQANIKKSISLSENSYLNENITKNAEVFTNNNSKTDTNTNPNYDTQEMLLLEEILNGPKNAGDTLKTIDINNIDELLQISNNNDSSNNKVDNKDILFKKLVSSIENKPDNTESKDTLFFTSRINSANFKPDPKTADLLNKLNSIKSNNTLNGNNANINSNRNNSNTNANKIIIIPPNQHQRHIQDLKNTLFFTSLKDSNQIGRGGFSTVYYNKYKSTPVARKVLKFFNIENFIKEIKILNRIKHCNVPLFYGCYLENKNDLEKYIYKLSNDEEFSNLMNFVKNGFSFISKKSDNDNIISEPKNENKRRLSNSNYDKYHLYDEEGNKIIMHDNHLSNMSFNKDKIGHTINTDHNNDNNNHNLNKNILFNSKKTSVDSQFSKSSLSPDNDLNKYYLFNKNKEGEDNSEDKTDTIHRLGKVNKLHYFSNQKPIKNTLSSFSNKNNLDININSIKTNAVVRNISSSNINNKYKASTSNTNNSFFADQNSSIDANNIRKESATNATKAIKTTNSYNFNNTNNFSNNNSNFGNITKNNYKKFDSGISDTSLENYNKLFNSNRLNLKFQYSNKTSMSNDDNNSIGNQEGLNSFRFTKTVKKLQTERFTDDYVKEESDGNKNDSSNDKSNSKNIDHKDYNSNNINDIHDNNNVRKFSEDASFFQNKSKKRVVKIKENLKTDNNGDDKDISIDDNLIPVDSINAKVSTEYNNYKNDSKVNSNIIRLIEIISNYFPNNKNSDNKENINNTLNNISSLPTNSDTINNNLNQNDSQNINTTPNNNYIKEIKEEIKSFKNNLSLELEDSNKIKEIIILLLEYMTNKKSILSNFGGVCPILRKKNNNFGNNRNDNNPVNSIFSITTQKINYSNLNINLSIINEYIQGTNLDKILPKISSVLVKLKLITDLAFSLDYLNNNCKIIHRDLKPNNIILDKKTITLKILDFGISKVIDRTKTTTMLKGTVSYMAPENFAISSIKNSINSSGNGKGKSTITDKVDVWAFACILNEAFGLFNLKPWKGEDNDSVVMGYLISGTTLPINSGISNVYVRSLIKKCSKVDPTNRPGFGYIRKYLVLCLRQYFIDQRDRYINSNSKGSLEFRKSILTEIEKDIEILGLGKRSGK